MPNYDYKCDSCKEVFEVFQRMSDPVVTVCPKCGKSTVERLITGGNFTFKGSGFYITDYKTQSAPKEAPIETPTVTPTITPKSDT